MSMKAIIIRTIFLPIACPPIKAADLTVIIKRGTGSPGEISCAMFHDANGFPMDHGSAIDLWAPRGKSPVKVVYKNLSPGTYADSTMRDSKNE